jgi:NAD(P)-dependent dehydrogenase (short-subunit alcohol dehydrogenase family)
MSGLCAGRTVIVTGAGRGIGRAHALAFAAEGARVVVNDAGVALDGESSSDGPAAQTARDIEELGGKAVASTDDVADFDGAANLVNTAVAEFGALDVLVNNAGFLRDRMLVNLGEQEWDAVVRVHLKGHFAMLRHAAEYWRAESKAGRARDARIINTSSGAGLRGSLGQGNYSAAKSGILGLTLVAAAELARYGVAVNAIAPAARTRMTAKAFAEDMAPPEDGFDAMAPENVAPLVVWLGSSEAAEVTGRVFEVAGGEVAVAQSWRTGPSASKNDRWRPAELGPVVRDLLDQAGPAEPVHGA